MKTKRNSQSKFDARLLDYETLRKRLVKQSRSAASTDIDALIAAGDLIPKSKNWYVLRDISVLGEVHHLLGEMGHHTVNGQNEIRVKLTSVEPWEKLAAKLSRDA